MLQDNLLVQSSGVKQSLKDGNNRLFPNFGKKTTILCCAKSQKSENLSSDI
jgi:hypothetical protein